MKNKITVAENTVTKRFGSVIACDKEKYILDLLQGTGLAPQLISSEKLTIQMEYVTGITLSQAIDRMPHQLPHIFEKLADMMLKFNNAAKDIVLGDINLKNFIYNPVADTVTAIDFESWYSGDNIINLAAIPAMIETAYLPDNTAEILAQYTADYICSNTGIQPQKLQELSATEKQKIIIRRKAMAHIRRADCVILAGGKSSRMGTDKGLLQLDEYTFTDRLIYTAQLFDNLYISSNSAGYTGFGYPVITDIYMDKGPIGAFHACLQASKKEYVFFIPCDSPFITEKTVLEFFSKADLSASCNPARCDDDRLYPTVGLYNKKILPLVQRNILQDNLRLMSLFDKSETYYVELTNSFDLRNINTVEEYNNIL